MSLRSFILHNLWLKIFSLFFATLIWFAIQSNPSDAKFPPTLFPIRLPTLILRCPVTVMTLPGARSAFSVQPSEVVVKVRGDEAVLKRLTPENIQVYVKVTDGPNPSRSFRVEVIVPRDVTLKEVAPEEVVVQPALPAEK